MKYWGTNPGTSKRIETSRIRETVILLMLVIGILLSVYGVMQPAGKWWTTLLLTFGTTFTASALISIIMLSAGMMDLAENAKDLASVIGSRLGMPCAERFTLVESSLEVGLAKTYISRQQALEIHNFHEAIKKEKDSVFVVGSSLLGFLQDRHFEHVANTLRSNVDNGMELKLMLTHPLFADFRAAQEGRDPGDIGGEIIKTLRLIAETLMSADSSVSVYLYRGTPTCFGILTKERLLLNPYPYGRQAYESPCFEFDYQTPAYNFYRAAHFQTQFAGKIEKIDMSPTSIDKLEKRTVAFSKKVQEFEIICHPRAQDTSTGDSEIDCAEAAERSNPIMQ